VYQSSERETNGQSAERVEVHEIGKSYERFEWFFVNHLNEETGNWIRGVAIVID
jgi:hypothetical protein